MNLETFSQAERLEKEDKKDEAISAYSDFISQCQSCGNSLSSELREKLALAYNNRGFQRYLKVEFKLAVEDYTSALEYDRTLAVALYNRGLIHYRLTRFAEAIADMKEALTLNPDLEPAKLCLQQSEKDLELRSSGSVDRSS